MFSKKRYTLFISQHFVEPGRVTIGKTASFEGFEALAYDEDTLADILRRVRQLFKKNIRIVLSEELAYVTRLSFPISTSITRDLVRRALEEATPEDLQTTAWDFRTLRYVKKQETGEEILVQAAVMEGKFFHNFSQALEAVPLTIESIVPESYALAQLAINYEGASLIVARDRESTLLAAVENGFVIAARVQREGITLIEIEKFLSFVIARKSVKVARLIFSRFTEEELKSFQKLEADGYELIREDYNPLVGAAMEARVAGQDEEVLNLNNFLHDKQVHWWKFW